MSSFELHVFDRSPFVYTKRLEDMNILKKDFTQLVFQDIIQAVYAESKPLYKDIHRLANNINLSEHEQQQHTKDESHYKLTFDELKSKVEELKNKMNSNVGIKINAMLKIKAESETNDEKLKTLLALCKPLRIVLVDMNKSLPKTFSQEIKAEIVTISDSDDEETVEQVAKFTNKTNITDSDLKHHNTGDVIVNEPPYRKRMVKNIFDFKNILMGEGLKDTLLVINNTFLKEIDAYQIGNKFNVVECVKKLKYSKVHKFQMGECKSILDIIACCWKNRQCYVSILSDLTQYVEVARFIQTKHSCHSRRCSCCCHYAEETILNTSQIPSSRSNFIESAMKFKKKYKWIDETKQKQPKVPTETTTRIYARFQYKMCIKMIELENSEGQVEYYEIGRDQIIYSKLVYKGKDKSSWLLNTLGIPRKRFNFIYKNPEDREKKIVYNKLLAVISVRTYHFLKEQKGISLQCNKKHESFCVNYSPKVQNKRSFWDTSNKKFKVISIWDQIRKNSYSISAYRKRPCDSKQPPERRVDPPPSSTISNLPSNIVMEDNASQNINNMIQSILHRFRNVLLTINDDGRVAAALNAPLTSLSPSELEVLSQILSHAQTQVDKLGLTPGTCLNPETPMLVNPSAPNVSSASSQININQDIPGRKTQKLSGQTAGMKNNYFTIFSQMIGQKKIDYEASFRSYLGDTTEITPRITNVFSLNSPICTSSNIVKDPLMENVISYNDDNVSNKNTEVVNYSDMTVNTCVRDTEKDIIVLDDEPESQKSQKRKNNLKSNTKSKKNRLKSTAKIKSSTHVSNTVTNNLHHEVDLTDETSNPSMTSLDENPEITWNSKSKIYEMKEKQLKRTRDPQCDSKPAKIRVKSASEIKLSSDNTSNIDDMFEEVILIDNISNPIKSERTLSENAVDTHIIHPTIEFVGCDDTPLMSCIPVEYPN